VTQKEIEYCEKLPMNEQYAHLCALAHAKQYDARYAAGLEDYERIISIDGLVQIAINWQDKLLLAGTECVEVACNTDEGKSRGWVRVIGHFIVTFDLAARSYALENLSPNNGHPHPHAHKDAKVLCMTNGNNAVHSALTDGLPSIAMDLLMRALRMREGTVSTVGPPRPLREWPLKKGDTP
jgi:hypothetical protein